MTRCKGCGGQKSIVFLDLGVQPLPNQFLPEGKIDSLRGYPLRVMYCPDCHLVQLADLLNPECVFDDEFKYFSSYSESLLLHSDEYASMIIDRLKLKKDDRIIEIASNDGYLLQYFKDRGYQNILGVEPTLSTAQVAEEKGIPTHKAFFSEETARQLVDVGRGDLMIANNVIAHVPDLNDFFSGIKALLKETGVMTVEFQSLEYLIENVAFDLIYHEHYSYLSLTSLMAILERHDLMAIDVERLSTQGGSLRVYICHRAEGAVIDQSIKVQLNAEEALGLNAETIYTEFASKVEAHKLKCLKFFEDLKKMGATIAGYGAPAKGNVMLNGLGIDHGDIPFTVDRNAYKQNLIMAGCRIPVYPVEKLYEERPEYIVILPWNIRDEIIDQNKYIREWGGKFVTLIPEIKIL